MNKSDKKVMFASILYTNKRDILVSYPMNETDTFFSNTCLNVDVLQRKYGMRNTLLSGTANALLSPVVDELAYISKNHDLVIIGHCIFSDYTHGLYCIRNGEVFEVELQGVGGFRITQTVTFLQLQNIKFSTGDGDLSKSNCVSPSFVEFVVNHIKDHILTRDKNTIDNIIKQAFKTNRCSNTQFGFILLCLEFLEGCKVVESFINQLLNVKDFDIRERYPWIDAVAIELQNYEEDIKYMSERLQYWEDFYKNRTK